MAFTARQVIDSARRRVLDTEVPYRYVDDDYLDGVNQCISTLLELQPRLFGKAVIHQAVPGILQYLGDSGEAFLGATRNLGLDGLTPGPAIRDILGADLSASFPGWTAATPDPVVVHSFPASGTKTAFYIYPPQPATDPHQFEIWQAEHPGTVSLDTDVVPGLRDHMLPAVANYAASFVLMADDEDPNTMAKADRFFQAFMAMAGLLEAGGTPSG